MKIARCFSVAVLGFFALAAHVQADPDADTSSNPNLQYDADGVPLSVSKPKAIRLSPAEVAELRKKQVQAAADKDWLLKNYEKQLQNSASTQSGDNQSSYLYYQLSSNKDLAKLAGLPSPDDDSGDSQPDYRTGDQESDQSSADLRSENSSQIADKNPMQQNYLKPFVMPFNAMGTGNGAQSNFTSFPSVIAPLYGTIPHQAQAQAPRSATSDDPADIDTPGMIASEKDSATLDLSLDVLPGESLEHARDHQDNNSELLTLPLPMNADQLHRQEAASLNPQNVNGVAPPPAPAPTQPKLIPVNPADEPIPASEAVKTNPPRTPIANPFDILNR